MHRCDTLKLRTISFSNYIVNGGLKLSSEKFPNIERLTFYHTTAHDTSWSCISSFGQLSHLILFACNIQDFHLRDFESLQHLQGLTITQCINITENSLEYASKVPGLTYLSLGSLPLFVDHKKSIQFFPKLEELLLDNISLHDDIFYGAAENLPELLLLDVSRSRLTECVLQDISMISSLESFFMVECTMVDDWALFLLSQISQIYYWLLLGPW